MSLFEKDPRIIVARSASDFSMIGGYGDPILGAILKNPNVIAKDKEAEIKSALTRDLPQFTIPRENLHRFPEYVRKTGSLLYEAYEKANKKPAPLTTPSRT